MAETTKPQQVILVGGGPVGLLITLRLAQIGVEVTLLEADPSLNTSPRAAHYSRPAVIEMQRAGILDDIRIEGFSLKNTRWCTIDGRTIAGMPSRDVNGEDVLRMATIDQYRLGRLIMRHIERYPSATILFNHRVVGLSQDNEKVTLEVETPEGRKTMSAGYVVGSDGAASTVRKLLGLPFEGHTWPQEVVATNVRFPFEEYGYWDSNFIVHPDHFTLIARITADGLWRCTYAEISGLSKEEVLARQPEKYAAILPGPKPPKYELLNISPYRLHQRCVPNMRVGRVVLAGDAAHACNPFGGMGLTGGLCDAGGLSDCLVGIFTGRVDDSILDDYARIRRQIWYDVINPVSSSNKCRLHECDPDKAAEQDPTLQDMKTAQVNGTTEEFAQKVQDLQMSIQYDFTKLYKPQKSAA